MRSVVRGELLGWTRAWRTEEGSFTLPSIMVRCADILLSVMLWAARSFLSLSAEWTTELLQWLSLIIIDWQGGTAYVLQH